MEHISVNHAYLGGNVLKSFADMVYPSFAHFAKQNFSLSCYLVLFSLHWITKHKVNLETTYVFFHGIFAIKLSDPICSEKCTLHNILNV